jgi:hypothetical protein
MPDSIWHLVDDLLAGRRRPRPQSTVTTSHIWRRRLPVDAISRGIQGQAITLNATGIRSVGITPWWEIPFIRGLALGGNTKEDEG